MVFDIEFHFESPILALRDKPAKLGKACRNIREHWGGWLILKNWVAEGVASEVNDSDCAINDKMTIA